MYVHGSVDICIRNSWHPPDCLSDPSHTRHGGLYSKKQQTYKAMCDARARLLFPKKRKSVEKKYDWLAGWVSLIGLAPAGYNYLKRHRACRCPRDASEFSSWMVMVEEGRRVSEVGGGAINMRKRLYIDGGNECCRQLSIGFSPSCTSHLHRIQDFFHRLLVVQPHSSVQILLPW